MGLNKIPENLINDGLGIATQAELDERGISVKKFVAKGDGVADDTTAIQNAINLAQSLGINKVYLPSGRYLISSTLSLPSYMMLSGCGEKSEIFTNTNNLNLIKTTTNAEKVIIRDIKLTGTGTGIQPTNVIDSPDPSGAGCGIVMIGVSKGLIENVIVNNCGGDGTAGKNGVAAIWLTYGCSDCVVTKCRITNCRNGINEDNFFCSATKDAINNIFSENFIDNCRFGIATDCYLNAKGCQIISNVIRNSLYSAIDVNKTSFVSIRGNWIEGNGNTTIANTYSPAIAIYGDSNGQVPPNNVLVENNILINNYGHGIKIANNAYYTLISNNQINGCKNGNGILLQAARYYTIKGNIIQNNYGSGIYANPLTLNGTSVSIDKGMIEGNHIRSNGNHGIYMENAQFVVISSNRIDNNSVNTTITYSGINLGSNSTYNVITNNVIQGTNHKYGIAFIDAQTNLNVVSGNIMNSNNQDIGQQSNKQYLGVNLTGSQNSLTLRSPSGSLYKIVVADDGSLSSSILNT